jgi:CRISPR/Cas system-associated exonuclease Cas4 (RecB family)
MIEAILEENLMPDVSRRTGLVVHQALSYVDHPAQIDFAVKKCLQDGLILTEEVSWLKGELEAITQHPDIAHFFDYSENAKSRNELAMAAGGSSQQIKRPDRCIVYDNHTVELLDYKTGEPLESHKRQINQYGDILEKSGLKVQKKYLLYSNEKEVISV